MKGGFFMKNQVDRLSLNSIIVILALILALIGLFAGCSSTAKRSNTSKKAVKEYYELQKPIEVKNSEKDGRPEWTRRTAFEKDGNIYFSGGFLDGSDYAITIRCANAEALKIAIQSVSQFIRAEFTEYVQGSNTGTDGVDRYVEDGIATFTNKLHLQGIRQKAIYYEENFSPSTMHSYFNVFVMLEMGKADYLKAKVDVLRKLRDRFSSKGQIEAKEKAEKLLEKLKKDIEKEAGYGA
jgi:hypothetical protein